MRVIQAIGLSLICIGGCVDTTAVKDIRVASIPYVMVILGFALMARAAWAERRNGCLKNAKEQTA